MLESEKNAADSEQAEMLYVLFGSVFLATPFIFIVYFYKLFSCVCELYPSLVCISKSLRYTEWRFREGIQFRISACEIPCN